MRLRLALPLLAALLLPGVLLAQQATIYDAPLSERRVAYSIDATLDPATRTVDGKQRLTWRNPGNVPVGELQFHLYLNAFKPGSTFMKESGGSHRGFSADGDDRWGGITVTSMQVAQDQPTDAGPLANIAAADLTDQIRFIQPDDQNPTDQTVIAVTLPEPVPPGETIALDIAFAAKMPRIVARTGWAETDRGNDFFMVAQWFPKIGVYEVPGQRYVPADAPEGQWNTHQFHANSEFYADFGTYDVSLTTPADFTVGASGILVDDVTEGETRTVRYRADDVHDFAWTTSPDYVEFTDQWRHVSLRLLAQPEHADQADRHFESAKAALDRFDAWVGEYPYTTLTLVDGIGGSNGMEYPTLITCGTIYKLPAWARPLELVTIHEFGHQYFYGILASNEFEEAWLDEGMNSYLESRIMDDVYGQGSVIDLPFLRVSDGGMQRLSYTKNRPARGAIFTKSWEYQFSSDFGKASYAKPATVMNTLERYLGWETMQAFLRTYYDRWRFRHPTTRDLIDVAEEVSGQDLGWFFDQYVYGTAVVDYKVEYVSNERLDVPASPAPMAGDSTETEVPDWYRSTVLVRRQQDGTFPQTLLVRFEDGTEKRVQWDGREAWKRFTFEQPGRALEAYLDPDNVVWLDVNRLNNRALYNDRADAIARQEQLKFTTRFQQVLYFIAGLF